MKVGELDKTTFPVPVSSEITPANSLDEVAERTFNLSVVTTNVFEVGIAVLLIVVAVAAPKTGVTKVGDVANTATPVPVSSDKAVAKLADVNEPNDVAFPVDVTAPVKFALVTTVVAFPTLVTIPVKLALVVFAAVTKAVVANAVVLLPAVWVTPIVPVGKDGVPVKVGEARGAAPVTSATGIDAFAVMADVPFPFTYPVKVVAPDPPLATAKVPETFVAKFVITGGASVPYPCPMFQ